MRYPTLHAPPIAAFRADVRPERGRVVVAVSGELDLTTAETLEQEVNGLFGRGFTSVVVDLRDLTFHRRVRAAAARRT